MTQNVQFGGNTAGLESALKRVNKFFDATNNKIKSVSRASVSLNKRGGELRTTISGLTVDGQRFTATLDRVKTKTGKLTKDWKVMRVATDSAAEGQKRLQKELKRTSAEAAKVSAQQAKINNRKEASRFLRSNITGNRQLFPDGFGSGTTDAQRANVQAAIAATGRLIERGEFTRQQFARVGNDIRNNLNAAFTGPEAKAAAAFRRIDAAMRNTGTTAQEAAKKVILTWTGVIRLFAVQALHLVIGRIISSFREMVTTTVDLSKRIAEIGTISRNANAGFGEWSSVLKEVSNNFGLDLLDVAEGAYQALSNQVANAATVQGFLNEAASFGRITNSSLTDSVNLLSSAVNAYSSQGLSAARASEVFFKTIELGRVRASELANTLGTLLPLTSQLGVSVEEAAASVATLTIQGIRSDTALTLMRNVMLGLIKPTDSMKQLMEEWGVSTGEAAIATFGLSGVLERLNQEALSGGITRIGELAGRLRNIQGVIGTTGNAFGKFNDNLREIQENAASSFDIADRIASNSLGNRLSVQFREFQNFFRTELGPALSRSIADLVDRFGGVDTILKNLIGPFQSFFNIMSSFTEVITAVITPIADMASSLGLVSAGGSLLGPILAALTVRWVTMRAQVVASSAATLLAAAAKGKLGVSARRLGAIIRLNRIRFKNLTASIRANAQAATLLNAGSRALSVTTRLLGSAYQRVTAFLIQNRIAQGVSNFTTKIATTTQSLFRTALLATTFQLGIFRAALLQTNIGTKLVNVSLNIAAIGTRLFGSSSAIAAGGVLALTVATRALAIAVNSAFFFLPLLIGFFIEAGQAAEMEFANKLDVAVEESRRLGQESLKELNKSLDENKVAFTDVADAISGKYLKAIAEVRREALKLSGEELNGAFDGSLGSINPDDLAQELGFDNKTAKDAAKEAVKSIEDSRSKVEKLLSSITELQEGIADRALTTTADSIKAASGNLEEVAFLQGELEKLLTRSDTFFASGDLDSAERTLDRAARLADRIDKVDATIGTEGLESDLKSLNEAIKVTAKLIEDADKLLNVEQKFTIPELSVKIRGTDDLKEAINLFGKFTDQVEKAMKTVDDLIKSTRQQVIEFDRLGDAEDPFKLEQDAIELFNLGNIDQAKTLFQQVDKLINGIVKNERKVIRSAEALGVRFRSGILNRFRNVFSDRLNTLNQGQGRLQGIRGQTTGAFRGLVDRNRSNLESNRTRATDLARQIAANPNAASSDARDRVDQARIRLLQSEVDNQKKQQERQAELSRSFQAIANSQDEIVRKTKEANEAQAAYNKRIQQTAENYELARTNLNKLVTDGGRLQFGKGFFGFGSTDLTGIEAASQQAASAAGALFSDQSVPALNRYTQSLNRLVSEIEKSLLIEEGLNPDGNRAELLKQIPSISVGGQPQSASLFIKDFRDSIREFDKNFRANFSSSRGGVRPDGPAALERAVRDELKKANQSLDVIRNRGTFTPQIRSGSSGIGPQSNAGAITVGDIVLNIDGADASEGEMYERITRRLRRDVLRGNVRLG